MEQWEDDKAQLEADTQAILADIEKDQQTEDTKVEETVVEESPLEEKVEIAEQAESQTEEKPAEIKTEISRQVPLAKYQEKKNEWKEEKAKLLEENQKLKTELEQKSSKVADPVVEDKKLSEIAKKWNLDEDLVKDLGQAFSKSSLPDEVMKEIQELREEKMISKQKEAIEEQYKEEFSNLEKTFKDIDFSNVDKDKLKDYAFSPAYSKTPLDVIFRAFKDDLIKPVGRKGLETSKPDHSADSKTDITKFTDEDIPKMSNEEFDAYMKAKEKGGLLS